MVFPLQANGYDLLQQQNVQKIEELWRAPWDCKNDIWAELEVAERGIAARQRCYNRLPRQTR